MAPKPNGDHAVIEEKLKNLDQKITNNKRTSDEKLDKIESAVYETRDVVMKQQPEHGALMKELWTPEGRSRMMAAELCVKTLDDRLHLFVGDVAKKFESMEVRKWELWKMLLGAVLILITFGIEQWFILHYIAK